MVRLERDGLVLGAGVVKYVIVKRAEVKPGRGPGGVGSEVRPSHPRQGERSLSILCSSLGLLNHVWGVSNRDLREKAERGVAGMKGAAGLERRLDGVEEARVSSYWKGGMEQWETSWREPIYGMTAGLNLWFDR